MKRFIKFGLMLALMLSPLFGYAAGEHTDGRVQVINIGTSTIIYGQYNVRYNPAVSVGFISASFVPGSSMTISARDSTSSVTASCVVASTDALWDSVKEVMSMSLGNGTSLWAQKSNSSGKCTAISTNTDSRLLD
jgi:hypothetical protein